MDTGRLFRAGWRALDTAVSAGQALTQRAPGPLGEPSLRIAEGSENNGLVAMLHQLLSQNLADHPHKKRDLFRLLGRVAIVVEDAGVCLTLHFLPGVLTFHDGIVGIPDVTIRAGSSDIMQMSLIELVPRVGVPDLRKENARAVIEAQRSGQVKMVGTLGNMPMVLRLTRLMSVNP